MAFKCGLVGLPNVGKSTLFNALTNSASAMVGNYPFCTIEPNLSKVPLEDERLDKLADLSKSAKVIPSLLTFVDIAGLVANASKGEGLGNKFLEHIREVDLLVHVLRCFEDSDIQHVDGQVNPLKDLETIETELILSDLSSIERQRESLNKLARAAGKPGIEAKEKLQILNSLGREMNQGKTARKAADDLRIEKEFVEQLHLLTYKKAIYICNLDEAGMAQGNQFSKEVADKLKDQLVINICADVESQIAQLESKEERKEFLESIGFNESGLSKIVRAGHEMLGLSTFFTTGEKETKAWTVKKDAPAVDAAAVIHTDFAKGFIRAEVISCEDFLKLGSRAQAKEAGLLRSEGRDYPVQDGDILNFLFNV